MLITYEVFLGFSENRRNLGKNSKRIAKIALFLPIFKKTEL